MSEQGYSGERYPSAPPARPSLETGATPSELAWRPRPRVVDIAYWSWLGACLVGVITAVVTLVYFDQLQAGMSSIVAREFPNETPATRDEVATVAVAILIGAGALVAVVQVAFAVAMRSGRGWARLVLVLLGVLGVLYTVVTFGAAPVLTQAGMLATTALMLIAVVLMCLPVAGPWFAQQRLARSGGYGE